MDHRFRQRRQPAKYDERRADLIARLKRSLLYFPPAKAADWSLARDGDHLYVSTTCVDRMYVARFTVELTRDGDKKWKYVRLLASELFKGE